MAKEPFAARLTAIWIGGFFFWIIKGFKGKLKDQFMSKYDKRNGWIGYIITIIVAIIIVTVLI